MEGRHGTFPLLDLFAHVTRVEREPSERIWYGGGRLKRYGKGFKVSFIDRPGDLYLSTYVSSDALIGYRYRAQLEEILNATHLHRYVTCYVWGFVQESNVAGKLSLNPEKLHHLAIVLGPLEQEQDSPSVNTLNK